MSNKTICFIGAGNMSRSMIAGLVKNGYPAQQIIATNRSRPKLDALESDYGIVTTQDNNQGIQQADVVLLSVKPQLMAEVCRQFSDDIDFSQKLVISVAAGIEVSRLKQLLGQHTPIVRVMPNTPSLLGLGMSGLYAAPEVSQASRDFAGDIIAMMGEILWVDEEAKINGVIAAAGSSPAYFFAFLEAMQAESERQGFNREEARLLVQQAMLGAANMVVANPDISIGTLREQVTSKGGSTAAALNVFIQSGLDDIVAQAMQAAIARSEAMAKEF